MVASLRKNRKFRSIAYSALCAGMFFVLNASLCSTDPEEEDPTASVTVPFSYETVYVTEPIDFVVSSDLGSPTYSVSGLPAGASLDAATGAFSWRPATSETGSHTAVFSAVSGDTTGEKTVTFNVVLPQIPDGEAIQVLRPTEGATYTYGDTVTVAMAVKKCVDNSIVLQYVISEFNLCDLPSDDISGFHVTTQAKDDSLHDNGNAIRFMREIEGQDMMMAFYKLALEDASGFNGETGEDCTADFGGGTTTKTGLKLKAYDPYGADFCDSGIGSPMLAGAESGSFTVKP